MQRDPASGCIEPLGGIVGINPRLVAYATALLLTGCVGQVLQEGLHGYSGKPASALFSKLGLPTAEQTIAGHKVYIWTTSNFVEGTNYGCKLRVNVDAQDNVVGGDWDGNNGGCAVFASRLG